MMRNRSFLVGITILVPKHGAECSHLALLLNRKAFVNDAGPGWGLGLKGQYGLRHGHTPRSELSL